MKFRTAEQKNNILLSTLKGSIVAVSLTLIMILVFAMLIRFFNINDNWIFPVNQVIKIVSLFFGICISIKQLKQNGFLQGVLVAITYFIINYFIFSILQGYFAITMSNIYDLLLTTIMGGIIGIIIINLKR